MLRGVFCDVTDDRICVVEKALNARDDVGRLGTNLMKCQAC
jgi:hypothetical protein